MFSSHDKKKDLNSIISVRSLSSKTKIKWNNIIWILLEIFKNDLGSHSYKITLTLDKIQNFGSNMN
jgi:hypothetical protein